MGEMNTKKKKPLYCAFHVPWALHFVENFLKSYFMEKEKWYGKMDHIMMDTGTWADEMDMEFKYMAMVKWNAKDRVTMISRPLKKKDESENDDDDGQLWCVRPQPIGAKLLENDLEEKIQEPKPTHVQ